MGWLVRGRQVVTPCGGIARRSTPRPEDLQAVRRLDDARKHYIQTHWNIIEICKMHL